MKVYVVISMDWDEEHAWRSVHGIYATKAAAEAAVKADASGDYDIEEHEVRE